MNMNSYLLVYYILGQPGRPARISLAPSWVSLRNTPSHDLHTFTLPRTGAPPLVKARHLSPHHGPSLPHPCSYPILSYPILSYPILSYAILSCLVLSCPVLSCPVLPCPVLSCPVLSYPIFSYPLLNPILSCLIFHAFRFNLFRACLLYTSPSPRDQRGSRMPSSA